MPKGTTAEERREAVLIPADAFADVDDVETAFNDWRAGLDQSTEPGTVRAFELQMDERGMISTTRAQIRLGSWPIDAYSFDELCTMLVRDFMDTTAKRMAVRLVASRPGVPGNAFNKVVVLKRRENANGAEVKESTASLMKAIQENNKELMAQFRAMIPPKPDHDPTTELAKIIAISSQLNAPMMTMLQSLLPALAGRPTPAAADPFAGFSGLIDVATKLAELKGGGGEGGNGPDWLEAIKAVVPLAKPALEALAAIRPVAILPQPRPAIAPPPGSVPTQPPPTATRPPDGSQPSPAGGGPAAGAPSTQSSMSMGDIPSGDIQMFAQLKPQIDSLVQIAKDGGDPVGAADLLFEEMILSLPDEYYEKLGDMFARENLVNQLAVFHPAVLQYREFFDKFRKQVDARFDREDVEAGDRPTIVPQAGS